MATGDCEEEGYQQEDKEKIENIAHLIPVYNGYRGTYCPFSICPMRALGLPLHTFSTLTLTNFRNLMAGLARHATPRIAVPRLLFLYPRCAQHRLLGSVLSGVRPRDTQPQVDSPSAVRPVEGAPHSTSPSSTQASDPESQRRLLESAQPGPPPPVPKVERPRPRLRASKAAVTLVCLICHSGHVLSIRN